VAITQVGSATTGTDASSGGPFSVTKPTGVTSGDVLFVVGASNEGSWDTLPSGFTQQYVSTDANTTNNFRVYVWTKVCGGSEPASYSFGSTTAGGSGAPMVVVMTAWRGVDNTTPVLHSSNADAGTSAEPSNPATSFTQTGAGRVVFARSARSTTAIPTFSTGDAGWSELADVGEWSGGTVRYGIGFYAKTADTSSGSQAEPAVTCATTETDNVFNLFCLKAEPVSTNASAGAVSATATAYDASTIATVTGVTSAAAVATAYNATVLTGVAAENTGFGAATVTAYNAAGWVIHPVNVGVQAFDATVAIGVSAERALASVAVNGAVAYFGAPASRVWKIGPEDRTWPIPPEDRTYNIVAENRAWQIPPKD
jgi:hypothetical protein